jgi:hypothetical protein
MSAPNLVIVPQRPGTVTPTAPSTSVPTAEAAAWQQQRQELVSTMYAQARWLPLPTLS